MANGIPCIPSGLNYPACNPKKPEENGLIRKPSNGFNQSLRKGNFLTLIKLHMASLGAQLKKRQILPDLHFVIYLFQNKST
jgi:hypothetical protein